MMEAVHSAGSQLAPHYPRYSAAVLGFRNYWYPALFARDLKDKPVGVTLCGEKIALFRDQGRVYGLQDRCPHRGIPRERGLDQGRGDVRERRRALAGASPRG